MNEKEYEQMKVKLNRYRDMVGQVSRRTEEVARWNSMVELSATEYSRIPGRSGYHDGKDMGSLKSTAMTLEKERDELAVRAMEQRRQLCACIAMVGADVHRDILDRVYINGQTVKEAADDLQVTERTVTRRLRKAVGLLRECSNFIL